MYTFFYGVTFGLNVAWLCVFLNNDSVCRRALRWWTRIWKAVAHACPCSCLCLESLVLLLSFGCWLSTCNATNMMVFLPLSSMRMVILSYVYIAECKNPFKKYIIKVVFCVYYMTPTWFTKRLYHKFFVLVWIIFVFFFFAEDVYKEKEWHYITITWSNSVVCESVSPLIYNLPFHSRK